MIYFKIYIISQLLLSVSGQQNVKSSLWNKLPKECGRTRYDKHRVRIIDGERASLGQFPWMARLGLTRNGTIEFFCAGSLINRYYVVTAAHCEDDGDVVRLGENSVNSARDCDRYGDCAPPYQDIKVKSYKFLNFVEETHANDIGLIELEKPVQFNEYVQPICLPHGPLSHKQLVHKHVAIAGWGAVDIEDFTPAVHLMYVILPIVDQEQCDSMYPYKITESQLCIGYGEGGKDSCNGDSGGPASMSMRVNGERRNYLVGLVSYGLAMCGRGVAVYTDVTYFAKWIIENIEKS